MRKVNRPPGKWRNVVFGSISLLVILADQFSKTWIRANLAIGQSLFDIGFFQVVHVHNTGAAFGMFKDHSMALIIVAFVGIVAILLLVFVLNSHWPFLDSMLVRSAIALIIGGMMGNQIDRLRLGYVTDFIDFKVWPVWNIADASSVVGSIIIIYCLIFKLGLTGHKE